MPALYPIPGFSTHPDLIQTHTIAPPQTRKRHEKSFPQITPPLRVGTCATARAASLPLSRWERAWVRVALSRYGRVLAARKPMLPFRLTGQKP
jgi:hypothetical protein